MTLSDEQMSEEQHWTWDAAPREELARYSCRLKALAAGFVLTVWAAVLSALADFAAHATSGFGPRSFYVTFRLILGIASTSAYWDGVETSKRSQQVR